MIVFVVEDLTTITNEVHSVWSDLEAALEILKKRPIEGRLNEFSLIETWELNKGSLENQYPYIYWDGERFYTQFEDDPWYFDSAVEYRMKAVGALRDE